MFFPVSSGMSDAAFTASVFMAATSDSALTRKCFQHGRKLAFLLEDRVLGIDEGPGHRPQWQAVFSDLEKGSGFADQTFANSGFSSTAFE
jgi:hypothetical protein